MKPVFIILFILHTFYSSVTFANNDTESNNQVNELIDGFHTAASQADLAKYLGSFTATGVFMGTDDWERWSRPISLDKYVTERFSEGKGWTYKPVERHLSFSEDNNTAWFDEIIVSKKWGRFRGTGVAINQNGHWKIAHYALSFLVPNEAWEKVSEISSQAFSERKNK